MKILIVLIFGLILRLISLNQSLWLDEAITAQVAKNFNYWEIISKFSPYDFHPPLYYFLIKFWTGFFGYSEVALRMPSVIFSLLTAYIIYLIGKEIKDRFFGYWAMVFFLFNPLSVYYSQEARMYMMTTFFITLSLYFLFKFQKKLPDKKSKIKAQNRLNNFFSLIFF